VEDKIINTASDLLKLPAEFKTTIKNICKNPTDDALLKLIEELGIAYCFPKDREVEVFKIWLKAAGFMKAEKPDSDSIPIVAWVEIQAQDYIDGKQTSSSAEEIHNALTLRLSTLSEMFLKVNDLVNQVSEKMKEFSDKLVIIGCENVDEVEEQFEEVTENGESPN